MKTKTLELTVSEIKFLISCIQEAESARIRLGGGRDFNFEGMVEEVKIKLNGVISEQER